VADDEILRIVKPIATKVHRQQPDRVSIGDSAEAVLEGAVLDLLASPVAGGNLPLGAGVLPETMTVFALSASAAYLALGEREMGGRLPGWAGGGLEISWTRGGRGGETFVGRARVREKRRYTLHVDVETASAASGELLMTGEIQFVAVRGGRAVPITDDMFLFDGARRKAALRGHGVRPLRRLARALLSPRRTLRRLRAAVRRPRKWSKPAETPAIAGDLPRLTLQAESLSLVVGDRLNIAVNVQNPGPAALNLSVEAQEPFGFGVLAAPLTPMPFDPGGGEQKQVHWEVTAQRASEVNIGRPWLLEFVLRSGRQECARACLPVEVADPEPGRVYYILTEDCETFDGGELTGDYRDNPERLPMGNRNNFMDPQEYRVQMVEKPDAMNRVADKHGARWTHFWCTSQRFAAEWAAGQSVTGEWQKVIALLDESIRRGCARHEYAPHIHFGYEPDASLPPQPRLLYDKATDGLIPNEFWDAKTNQGHRYHGWDGGRKGFSYVKALGTFSDPDSKTGSLFKACHYLACLQRGHRQPLCTRTGASDFGVGAEDQRISGLAHLRNALVANADAGYHEGAGQYPRGRQAYFCLPADMEREIADLSQAALVQFKAATVRLDAAPLDALDAWFEQRWGALLAEDGSIAPGVHALVAYTHAMFMKGGSGRMEDTEGGDFARLDRHLEYVTARHPEIRFATMSEAALDFLDYYAPTLMAVIEPQSEREDHEGNSLRFRIRLLGRTIPVSPQRRHLTAVKPPAWLLPEQVQMAQVLRDGREIARFSFLQSPSADLPFEVDRRDASYELVLHLRQPAARPSEEEAWMGDSEFSPPLRASGALRAQSDDEVLRIPCPRVVALSRASSAPSVGDSASVLLPPGLLRLLMNPAAGSREPLGRGLHPLGTFPIAIAACAAAAACGDPEPLSPRAWQVEHVRCRWHKPLKQDSPILGKARLTEVEQDRVHAALETYDEATGILLMSGTARLARLANVGGEAGIA